MRPVRPIGKRSIATRVNPPPPGSPPHPPAMVPFALVDGLPGPELGAGQVHPASIDHPETAAVSVPANSLDRSRIAEGAD